LKNISIFGTSSDAGKSTITFVIAKILQKRGFKVTPFKAQNVSNNAKVADDNSEIAVAQYFQAKVLNLKTSYHINPILLKSGKGSSSSLIINGKPIKEQGILEYYKNLDLLKPIVKEAYSYLDERFDIVVAEGAGSPVELNLMDKDLSNIFIAKEFNTKVILVADIQKGGVFASVFGTYRLLPNKIRKNVIGVIVNKFQGDMRLFDEGVRIIEREFGLRVFGVLPKVEFNLGFEDSLSLKNFTQDISNKKISVAVINYPTMSNYNDFEPLLADSEVEVEFIKQNMNLSFFDMVILPGSKLTLEDLEWFKKSGLFDRVKEFNGIVFGICGGFEKMFEKLGGKRGLGIVDDEIVFGKKVLNRGNYNIFNIKLDGFELHEGVSKKYPVFFQKGRFFGTFLHEVFDSDKMREFVFKKIDASYEGFDFRKYKEERIDEFVREMESYLDVEGILSCISN